MKGTILFGIAFLSSVALQVFSSIPDRTAFTPIGRYSYIAEAAGKDAGTYTIDSPLVKNASESVVMIQKRMDIPVRKIQIERINGGFHITIDNSTMTKNVIVSSGSGFFVTSDGYLLTNKHVVSSDDGADYVVQNGSQELKARVVYRDPDYDIAVLKVSGNNFPTLSLSKTNNLKVGDSVTALGNAWGEYIDSAATGTVSSLDEDIEVAEDIKRRNGRWIISDVKLSDLIEATVKLYPGDSGGPLLNQQGEVVGVSVAIAVDEPVGYAIPIGIVKEALVKAGLKI